MLIRFNLNGRNVESDTTPSARLSEILREQFSLKSLHSGCKKGSCGICMVLLDNKPVYSCLVPMIKVRDRSVLTIEGIRDTPEWENMQSGIKQSGIHLCPYCAPARALSIVSLLMNYPEPDDSLIQETIFSVTCRCTGYQGLRQGILLALNERESPYHA